jgi:hypothetical protein
MRKLERLRGEGLTQREEKSGDDASLHGESPPGESLFEPDE